MRGRRARSHHSWVPIPAGTVGCSRPERVSGPWASPVARGDPSSVVGRGPATWCYPAAGVVAGGLRGVRPSHVVRRRSGVGAAVRWFQRVRVGRRIRGSRWGWTDGLGGRLGWLHDHHLSRGSRRISWRPVVHGPGLVHCPLRDRLDHTPRLVARSTCLRCRPADAGIAAGIARSRGRHGRRRRRHHERGSGPGSGAPPGLDVTTTTRPLLAAHDQGRQQPDGEQRGSKHGNKDSIRVYPSNVHCTAFVLATAPQKAEERE